MAYLDVSPMITALQRSPDQFAFATGSLHHIPSGHSFEFDRSGLVDLRAQCACSHLEISRDQEKQLFEAFRTWQVSYWRPLEINKQFADHFALSWWQRALVATTGWLFRVSLKLARRPHELESASVPAE
jgi:hypothetical protein